MKPGECLIVQDFAKNRNITYQDSIKENYWNKKQVTLHPSVLFYRSKDEIDIKTLYVTHISDITTHNAHIVHLITLDCISVL